MNNSSIKVSSSESQQSNIIQQKKRSQKIAKIDQINTNVKDSARSSDLDEAELISPTGGAIPEETQEEKSTEMVRANQITPNPNTRQQIVQRQATAKPTSNFQKQTLQKSPIQQKTAISGGTSFLAKFRDKGNPKPSNSEFRKSFEKLSIQQVNSQEHQIDQKFLRKESVGNNKFSQTVKQPMKLTIPTMTKANFKNNSQIDAGNGQKINISFTTKAASSSRDNRTKINETFRPKMMQPLTQNNLKAHQGIPPGYKSN